MQGSTTVNARAGKFLEGIVRRRFSCPCCSHGQRQKNLRTPHMATRRTSGRCSSASRSQRNLSSKMLARRRIFDSDRCPATTLLSGYGEVNWFSQGQLDTSHVFSQADVSCVSCRSDVGSFFQPAIDAIVEAVQKQKESAPAESPLGVSRSIRCSVLTPQLKKHSQVVFLVGGFAASPWLFSQLQNALWDYGLSVSRPDRHTYAKLPPAHDLS